MRDFTCREIKTKKWKFWQLTPASQVDVECPRARALPRQSHPKEEEHPQTYQPATQPQAPLCPAPHYSTRHTEARSSVEVKWKTPRRGETLNQESGGRKGNQEKWYYNRTSHQQCFEHNANTMQAPAMACACAEATYCWTGICSHARAQW